MPDLFPDTISGTVCPDQSVGDTHYNPWNLPNRPMTNFEILSLAPRSISNYMMYDIIPSVDELPGSELLAVAKAICSHKTQAYTVACASAANDLGKDLAWIVARADRALYAIQYKYGWALPLQVERLLIAGGMRGPGPELY